MFNDGFLIPIQTMIGKALGVKESVNVCVRCLSTRIPGLMDNYLA